jgi:hypothetical protein
MMKRDLMSVCTALKGRYCNQVGIDGGEFDQMIAEMGNEWEVYQSSCIFYAAYGKRGKA